VRPSKALVSFVANDQQALNLLMPGFIDLVLVRMITVH
jgi:hypothetical protein